MERIYEATLPIIEIRGGVGLGVGEEVGAGMGEEVGEEVGEGVGKIMDEGVGGSEMRWR